MNRSERKGQTVFVAVCCVCLGLAATIGARRHEYLDELCKDTSSPSLRLGFHMPKDRQAITLSLSQTEYPTGLNCCLTIVSDSFIAAELSEVNLRRDGLCIDNLEVVTETTLISVCDQEDQVKTHEDDASRTVESRGAMTLSFMSNSSVSTTLEETQALGFTVRILTYIKEKNEGVCKDHFHGFLCPRLGRCLPHSVVCDGEEDCYSGKDESAIICGDATDSPLPASFYTSPSILSVVLAVISTAFLLCICFWLVCASRRLMVGNSESQIIWNLFGSNPGMLMTPHARFLRNGRSAQRLFSQVPPSPTTPQSSTATATTTPPPPTTTIVTVATQGGTVQELPPPAYEALFGARPKINIQTETVPS